MVAKLNSELLDVRRILRSLNDHFMLDHARLLK
jgi:hypothetical protein